MSLSAVNHKDPSPLYLQIKSRLQTDIEAGKYAAGSLIPSEHELVRAYTVSQGTVRRALFELVNDGYLYRRQGKGTFVSENWASGDAQPAFLKFFFPLLEGQEQIIDRHHKELLRGIEIGLGDLPGDFEMLLDISLDEQKPEDALLRKSQLARGVFIDLLNPIPFAMPEELRIPCVTIHRHIAGVSGVKIDNVGGAESIVRHLAELGHRRIGFLRNLQSYADTQERFAGYLKALTDIGIPFDEELAVTSTYYGEGAYMAAARLLSLPNPPSAIFAPGWQMALGTLKAAMDRGLRIPDDLAVAAFDDLTDLYKPRVPLTTVRQPVMEMGRKAAEMLTALLEGRAEGIEQVNMPTELIIRESSVG